MDPGLRPHPQVRDEIVEKSPVSACGDVTEAHLAAIEGLALGADLGGITALQAGDFDGLTALTTLWVVDLQLGNVPAGVFDELISLETLFLTGGFSSLPDGVFDGLTALGNRGTCRQWKYAGDNVDPGLRPHPLWCATRS